MPSERKNLPGWKIWLLAARPKTLPAAIAPVLMGGAMAWSDGAFAALPWAVTLAAAVLIQIGTNFHNDLYDFLHQADTEDRLGPLRVTQAGLVSPQEMKRATAAVFGLAILLGIYLVYLGGWPILLIGALSILFGVLYTAGPRPIGYTGWADLFVLVFFGPVAVAGTYYLAAGHWSLQSVVAGLSPGMLSTALLTVNNLRDADNDRAAGKFTLAVRFGKSFARAEYTLLALGALLLPLVLAVLEGKHSGVALVLLALPLLIPAIGQVYRWTGPELNHTLAQTGKALAVFGLLFSIGWIL